MDRLMTGVGDGCDSCLIPRNMWTDEDQIDEGFPKNRTLENIRETWASLRKKEGGEVFKATGDYETRQGLCREPVTLRDTLSFTITHKVGCVYILHGDPNISPSYNLDPLFCPRVSN